MTGTLFDIKEFAVHDGPGIRTTIFLKGCPLRCAWCHNPEGLSFEPETLHTANGERQCGEAVEVSHLAERLRRASFLYGEDGGVTFSGGEPLAQAEFVLEMIDALKPIHVAVQTSGHAPVNVFQSIVEAVDLVMLDIKHSDREIHKRFTGVDNSLIGENLRFLVNSGKRFEVHIPLIPGVTDTRENIQPIADALASAGDRVSVLLMPYHRNAGAKYAMVGREFTPDWDENARVKDHSDIFHKAGIGSRML